MKLIDFLRSGYDNEHCEFVFANGTNVRGMISAFILSNPFQYQLVESANIHDFKRYKDLDDTENMLRLSKPVHISDIISAKILP